MLEIFLHYKYQACGLVGVALYISSYFLLQLGLLVGSGVRYTLMNLVAASFVLVSLTEYYNLASALIQVFWIGISIIGLARFAFIKSS